MDDGNDLVLSQWLDQEDQRISELIRKHGCAIQYVFGCASDSASPFAYTIGAFGLGHPELLVHGLDQSAAGGVLNHVFALVRSGRDLVPGEVLEFPQSPERWFVEEVPNPGEILFGANRHYRRPAEASVDAYQLTWSVDGRFPWDDGYRLDARIQPRPGTYDAQATGGCACCHGECSGPH